MGQWEEEEALGEKQRPGRPPQGLSLLRPTGEGEAADEICIRSHGSHTTFCVPCLPDRTPPSPSSHCLLALLDLGAGGLGCSVLCPMPLIFSFFVHADFLCRMQPRGGWDVSGSCWVGLELLGAP